MQSGPLVLKDISLQPVPGLLEKVSWSGRITLAFFFGCILGLSSPGFDISWLAWIGLAPLLVLLRSCIGKRDALFTGLAFGMGYHLVALSWYFGLFPLRWLGIDDWLGVQVSALVWLVESLHQSLLIGGFSFLAYCLPLRAGYLPYFRRPFFPYMLSVPLIWLYFQWVVGPSEFFIGIPIDQLAYSQSKFTELIQIARIGGSALVEFLIVLINVALAEVVLDLVPLGRKPEERIDRLSDRVGSVFDFLVASIVVACVVVWGAGEWQRVAQETRPEWAMAAEPQCPPIAVAVVQGNVTVEEDRLKTATPAEICERYASLAKNLGVVLIVLPEGVVNQVQMVQGFLLSRLKDISYREKKEVIVGTVESVKDARVNAARIISPQQPAENLYVKRRLIPIAEYALFKSLNEHIPQNIQKRLPAGEAHFVASPSTYLIKSMWGKVGVSIASELIYPRLIAREVRRGANLLVNLSNLSWFHGSSVNKNFLAAAVFRAVENGRFVVLSTNTGISAVIDPSGTVTAVSYPGRRGVIMGTVQFLYKKTPFSRMWWL
ncbi:MAG TPA: apolipoprotein N-acyltransferase [Candidatus Obscuribacterales bacterium]